MKQKSLACLLIIFSVVFVPKSLLAMEGLSMGEYIHTSMVDGFSLSYKLIDMRENIKKMEGDHDAYRMTETHHLMVIVEGSDDMKDAKVGFLVTNPDGEQNKAMAMGMGEGFGADIAMMKKGEYHIKTKIVKNKTKLIDEFIYQMP